MNRMPHPALVWAANLLVPGAGMVMVGRLASGLLVAGGWTIPAALALLGLIWPDAFEKSQRTQAVLLAILVYAMAQAGLFIRLRRDRRHRAGTVRDERFKDALAAYLRGELDASEAICRDLLRLDPDDVEATLHLAVLARRRGDAPAARRLLCRARYLDDEGRWDFAIARDLAALAAPDAARPR